MITLSNSKQMECRHFLFRRFIVMLRGKNTKKTVTRLAFLTTSLGLIMPLVTQTLKAEANSEKQWRAKVELEAKVGSKRSLGRVGAFAPIMQNADSMLFVDMHMMLDNKKQQEFNGGIGYRYMSSSMNAILGMYGYYDRRSTAYKNQFSQITVGFEMMAEQWDARLNVYIPETKTKKIDNTEAKVTFSGHDKLTSAKKEIALRGFDIEAGSKIPGIQGLSAHVGMYHFQGRLDSKSITGPKARINYEVNEYISFEGSVTQDRVRKTNAFAGVTLQFKLGDKGTTKLSPLSARMEETPIRDLDIISTVATEDKKTTGHIHVVTQEVADEMQKEREEKRKAEAEVKPQEEQAAIDAAVAESLTEKKPANQTSEEHKGEELGDPGIHTNTKTKRAGGASNASASQQSRKIGEGKKIPDDRGGENAYRLDIDDLGTAENPFILDSNEYKVFLGRHYMATRTKEYAAHLEMKESLEKQVYVHIHNDRDFSDVDGKLIKENLKDIFFAVESNKNLDAVKGLFDYDTLKTFDDSVEEASFLSKEEIDALANVKKSKDKETQGSDAYNIISKLAEKAYDVYDSVSKNYFNARFTALENVNAFLVATVPETISHNLKTYIVEGMQQRIIEDLKKDTWASLVTDEGLQRVYAANYANHIETELAEQKKQAKKPTDKTTGAAAALFANYSKKQSAS